jgi:Ca2+-binding EF-hand superfamily protein
MKTFLILAAAAGLALAGAAQAQMGGRLGDLFAGADTNHDGRVSRVEFIAARNAHFDRLDRNHDGVVSAADFPRLARFPAAEAKVNAMIAEADANHDGVVTRDEMANAPSTILDMADANHDGYVDQAELAAFRAKAQTMRGAR